MQLFATDIDSRAIATARNGLYPASIASDISPERLARYFTAQPNGSGYRVHKGLRDMLVFSEQNAIKDPPFSKLDLISCRNLLIYMGSELQKKLIPLFRYALNPGGYLFLGSSETVGEFAEQFIALDRKSKLYQRKEDVPENDRTAYGRFLLPLTAIDVSFPRAVGKTAPPPLNPLNTVKGEPVKLPLRELTEQALLQQLVQAGALVNGQGDILYLHGRTGMYLEPAPGEAGISNILLMAREGLKMDLIIALHEAVARKETVIHKGLHVKTNGDFTLVNLTVRPVVSGLSTAPDVPLYLIILEQAPPGEIFLVPQDASIPAGEAELGLDVDSRIEALKQELRSKDEYLQSTNEELETAHEEMQSVNEELQSTNEELETSKEELQSINEELTTVNTEL